MTTTTTSRIDIGLEKDALEGVPQILNRLLADEYVLYTTTRNYHWNVTGPDFSELHKFFEAQYEELNEIIDEVAERVRMLGAFALGTLREFSETARLAERPGDYPDARTMIGNLLAGHEALIRHTRGDADACEERFHDMGTNDFLIGVMQRHEKMAWMLRSYMQ